MYGTRTIFRNSFTPRLDTWRLAFSCWLCLLFALPASVVAWDWSGDTPSDMVAPHISTYADVTDAWSDWWDDSGPTNHANPHDAHDIWYICSNEGYAPDNHWGGFGVCTQGMVRYTGEMSLPTSSSNVLRRFALMPVLTPLSLGVQPGLWAFTDDEWSFLRSWSSRVPSAYNEDYAGDFVRLEVSTNFALPGRASNTYKIRYDLFLGTVVFALPALPVWYSPRGNYLFVDLPTLERIMRNGAVDLPDGFDYLANGPGAGEALIMRSAISTNWDNILYRKITVRFRGPKDGTD